MISPTNESQEMTNPTTSVPLSPPKSIPWGVSLISGGIAGTTVDVCLFPIDTLKTRVQSAQGFRAAGGFKGIYKGLSAAAAGSAPGAALFFTSYETAKPIIHEKINSMRNDSTKYSNVNSNPVAHMIAAGVGETCACLIRVPTEVVKQRMQTGQYTHFTQAITRISNGSGIRGFYVGYFTTVFREIPFAFIQFPIWERLKWTLAKQYYNNDSSKVLPWQGALCGSFAGGIAAAATTPLDVIKTRLMLGMDVNKVPYKGFVDCVTRMIRDEGSSVEYILRIRNRNITFFAVFLFFVAVDFVGY